MDLRGILNEPSTQSHRQQPQPPQPHPPPRLHTPYASYDHTPSYEPHPNLERPPLVSSGSLSYHQQPPPPSNEYRTSANGSYFPVQSPHQHHQHSAPTSASTPSATSQSVYAQSPGPHGQIHTPREGIQYPPPHQSPFVPSPSPSGPGPGPYPPTPGGSVHHYPNAATPSSATTYQYASAHPSLTGQSPTQREEFAAANGNAHAQQRHISPQAQFHPPPLTPLGPPVSYPRPSPHPHRPPSHGHESARRSSVGSVGSAQSREYNIPPYDHSRTGSGTIQRTYSGDVRERERSIESVSPKTIPKPPPVRRPSVNRYQEPMSDAHAGPQLQLQPQPQAPVAPNTNSIAQPQTTPDRVLDAPQYDTTPKSSSAPYEPKPVAQYHNADRSPAPGRPNNVTVTPQPAHKSLPPQQISPGKIPPQPSLKRTASNMSDVPMTPVHPRKRPRRSEIPVWAQNARRAPLKFIDARPPSPPVPTDIVMKKESVGSQVVNGQGQPNATTSPSDRPWEPSILMEPAPDDLTRYLCDWIFFKIGNRHLPVGGAAFEIEAKVGTIFDDQSGQRLSLPADTETVFNRQNYRGRTSFKSSMDVAQHKALNDFLNKLVLESVRQVQETGRPSRIGFSHPHEYDEFYELTPEGQSNLPPSIVTYLHPNHKPRVRRTIDETTNSIKAQIIKSRIADIEIFNPRCDFDYRISISIESPWEGDPKWLTLMPDGDAGDRKKDRLSYRHWGYQIDLTQVSYPGSAKKEHELEVEVSPEWIRREIDKLKAGQENDYEKLVRGFVDNVRIMCRQGTIAGQAK